MASTYLPEVPSLFASMLAALYVLKLVQRVAIRLYRNDAILDARRVMNLGLKIISIKG